MTIVIDADCNDEEEGDPSNNDISNVKRDNDEDDDCDDYNDCDDDYDEAYFIFVTFFTQPQFES